MFEEPIIVATDKPENALKNVSYRDFIRGIEQNKVVLSQQAMTALQKYKVVKCSLPSLLVKSLPMWSVLSAFLYLFGYTVPALLCLLCLLLAYPVARSILRKRTWNAILGERNDMDRGNREFLYTQLVDNDLLYAPCWTRSE